jgi:hypothetical protein
MVDGVDVGTDVDVYERKRCKNGCDFENGTDCDDCSVSFAVETQDFRDAEMVVVLSKSYGFSFSDDLDSAQKDGSKIRNHLFHSYAVYGNRLVSANITGTTLRNIRESGIKIVLANKRPYILNGD